MLHVERLQLRASAIGKLGEEKYQCLKFTRVDVVIMNTMGCHTFLLTFLINASHKIDYLQGKALSEALLL